MGRRKEPQAAAGQEKRASPAPVAVTAEELLERGLIPPEKRADLRRYLEAKQAFRDIFEPGPDQSEEQLMRCLDAVERLRESLRDYVGRAQAVLDRVGKDAMPYVEEVLKTNAPRLKGIQDVLDRSRQSLGRLGHFDADLEQLRDVASSARRHREELSRELTEIRARTERGELGGSTADRAQGSDSTSTA